MLPSGRNRASTRPPLGGSPWTSPPSSSSSCWRSSCSVFGAKKLPEIGRNLGSGAREFKDGITGHDDKPDGEAISGPTPREDEKVG